MKAVLKKISMAMLVLITCHAWGQTKQRRLDTAKTNSVKILPRNPGKYKMPVKKIPVVKDKMPVVNPDTSVVKPK
jgi:hypothetical protein